MTYTDPFGRRYRPAAPTQPTRGNGRGGTGQPTLEDYHQLSDAFQSLQKMLEEAKAQNEATQEVLRQQIKSAMNFQDQLGVANRLLEEVTRERDNALALVADLQGELTQLRVETSNYRTRLEQRLGRDADEKRLAVLRDMLPLADHLELALIYLDQNAGPDAVAGLRGNLVATRDAFLDTLRRHGVLPQQSMGAPFNPELHEAVGHMPSEDTPADRVALVIRAGYTADEQLLRPARVMISSGYAAEGV
ncbi:MAG: nucleotide exchange factor GrpE [Chloroflexi bacterium]|nr:MAG: nucleotide exchange factor GrpE [Chloroflexota bacterium]